MTARVLAIYSLLGVTASAGCSIAPKSFVQANDPAPLVRARAMGLSQGMPPQQAIPALINQLDDPDAVVRMTAFEHLKRRTGQDFGYAPWGDAQERAPAIAAWKSWWNAQQGRAYASSQQPEHVTPTYQRRGLFRRR